MSAPLRVERRGEARDRCRSVKLSTNVRAGRYLGPEHPVRPFAIAVMPGLDEIDVASQVRTAADERPFTSTFFGA
jgi:hypothetical protein